MRVIYQDCGCVALADEIVSALGLAPGGVIDISFNPGLKVAIVAVADPNNGETRETFGASCRIGTGSA